MIWWWWWWCSVCVLYDCVRLDLNKQNNNKNLLGSCMIFEKQQKKQIATNTNQIICSKSQDFYHLYYVFIRKFKKIFPSLSILFTIIAWSVCECACVCCAYFQLPQNLRIKTKIHPLGLYETIPPCPSRSWNQLSYIIYISPIYVWASFPSHMKCLRYFEFHVKQN